MYLVVGLGNPGEKYQNTRHNLGFMVVEKLAQELLPTPEKVWEKKASLKAQVIKGEGFILAKPLVAMNAAGFAVKKLVDFYQFPPQFLVVVHDDLDLALGQIKVGRKRGAAGHRGVESVIEQLGSNDFWRLRLGIGHPLPAAEKGRVGFRHENNKAREVADFVTDPFFPNERKKAQKMIAKAAELLVKGINKGMEDLERKYSI